jgi:hypothetical protein
MKRIIFNLVLAAVLNSLTERAKADTIALETTGAHVVRETRIPSPDPEIPPTTSYSINFSTPSINIQNGSEYLVFEYFAPIGIEYSLPYGGLLIIDGAFFTNSALGINSVVAGTISVSGLSAVDGYQLIFSGGVNGSDGFIYANNSAINFFGPASFSGISISIPIEGTGNNVNLGPENLQSRFTISSASMITAGSVSELSDSVPEPSAFSLLAVGLGGLAILRRRRA